MAKTSPAASKDTRNAKNTKNKIPETLTKRQQEILRVIQEAVAKQGFPPTVREIGEIVGLASTASVTYQLEQLTEKGFITRKGANARSMEVQDNPNQPTPERSVNIPLLGKIAAGVPITAQQEIDEVLTIPESLAGKGELFMLKVQGDSMIDAAICDGDYVVIRAQKDANKGEIVAAMIDGEATVKTWSIKNGKHWLLPANDNYAPIPADNAEILGKVTAVLRSV